MAKIIFNDVETKEAICLLAKEKYGLTIKPEQLTEETQTFGQYDDTEKVQTGWSVELDGLRGML